RCRCRCTWGAANPVGAPPASTAPAAGASEKPLPVTQGTKAPVDPAVSGAGDATHAKAVAALDRLAAAAADAQPWPRPLGDGKVLYVKTYNLQEDGDRYIHEAWIDPQTIAPLRIRRTDGAATNIDDALSQAEIDQVAAEPGDLVHPTPQYLAGLPADPEVLYAVWKAWYEVNYPNRADQVLWKDLYELYHYAEPFWTPQQRATIYGATGRIGGVVGTTATIAGHGYDVICRGTECLLFDSADGRYAGSATTGADHVVRADAFEFVDFGVQPRPQPGERRPVEKKTASTDKPAK
ncbi:hypothetical protein ABZS66_08955, partial [Dactylosporangium sp. NPDC005572]|uniref:hypothetical protein n=1 Tax=Dactylosporangium sp. NPDC005572 TaxID=3156889 RepID=UPI0033B8FA35